MMVGSVGLFLLQPTFFFCIASTIMRLSTANTLGNETDRLALLAFKDGVSDPLMVMNSWNDSLHFCQWEGVTCNHQHQRVIELNLESQGLIGSLTPYIGNFSFLRRLNIQNNSFQGEIPREVGLLFRLQELLMSNNTFSGKIPVNISNCTNLMNLSLRYNELTGEIPVEFGAFPKLVTLYLNVNNLTGAIPTSFGNLSSLETLYLSQNNLEERIPDSLGHMKRLAFLSLAVNRLSGTVPPSLFNISSLQRFSLVENQLEGSLSQIGFNFSNLRTFLVGLNYFSGYIPVSLIVEASALQKLTLAGNNFVGKVPTEVGSLKDLELLNVGSNYLGSRGEDYDDLDFITSLSNCSKLQALDIDNNHFGGTLPLSLANLSNNLNELYLGGNQISGSLPSDIGKLMDLIIFAVDSNFLSGVIPESIGMLQKLQILILRANKFSGQLPYSIGNISQLYGIDLSTNLLEGNISSRFDKCQSLKILVLSHNHIVGTIPKELLGVSYLTKLNLSHNSLTGILPFEVGNLMNLQTLDVSHNKISGEIPTALGSCLSLEYVYMQANFLQFPHYLGFSKVIQVLDISQNNLSGKVPRILEDLPYLRSLNLSFNNLKGEVPTKGIFQNVSAFSIVGNDELCGGIPELGLPKCKNPETKKRGMSLVLKVTFGLVLLLLIIIVSFFALYSRKQPIINPSTTQFLADRKLLLQRVSYNEIHKATDGFSSTNLIGMGSYGSVFKGMLHQDQSLIAVKVFNLTQRGASKSFVAECEVSRLVRQRNLLKIITVCSSVDFKGDDFKALVFEFMPNGSVESWLHPSSNIQNKSRNLNLLQRLDIAIDVASALDYLHNHCQTPIVHCDLKPSNLLLDDDMVAHVGDFGSAKILSNKTTNKFDRSETDSIAFRGTIGYIPPEYGMGAEVSTQGDIYSYGVFVLEMVTGKRPSDEMFTNGLSLHSFSKLALTKRVLDIIDTRLLSEIPNDTIDCIEDHTRTIRDQMHECLISILKIGVACSSEQIVERMDITDVLMDMCTIKAAFVRNWE